MKTLAEIKKDFENAESPPYALYGVHCIGSRPIDDPRYFCSPTSLLLHGLKVNGIPMAVKMYFEATETFAYGLTESNGEIPRVFELTELGISTVKTWNTTNEKGEIITCTGIPKEDGND